jgi:hypothetical protein
VPLQFHVTVACLEQVWQLELTKKKKTKFLTGIAVSFSKKETAALADEEEKEKVPYRYCRQL